MSEMIERVARAQCASAGHILEEFKGEELQAALDLARVAIEAMRDPTPKMVKAACAAMSPAKRPTPDRVGSNEKHRIRYRAMIDAALALPSDHHS